MYLLDTNVWVAYLRGKSLKVRQKLEAQPVTEIAICSVVLGELLYGTLRSAKPEANRIAVDALVAPFICLPYDAAAADQFSSIRTHLETRGTPIGPYDLQTAAIAKARGCTVVTHNTDEFGRVPGLLIEDWEAP